MKKEVKQLSKLTRVAESEIVRAEAGADPYQVKLIWSTGFKGLRSAWDGKFYEELDMSASAVDMSRLNKAAPVLAQHDASISSTIGVVERAWLDNGLGYADVRLSKRADVAGIVQDVIDGILRNVSVGYTVQEFTDVTKRGDTIKTLKATKWLPQEISLVSIGFDPSAQTLREDTTINEVTIFSEEEHMPTETKETQAAPVVETRAETVVETPAAPVVEAPKVDLEEIRRQAVAEYQTRTEEIRSAVKAAGLEDTYAVELIARNIPTAEASKEIFKTLEAKNAPKQIENGDSQKVIMNKRDQVKEALQYRLNPSKYKASEGNPFKNVSFMELCAGLVDRKQGESDSSFAKRALISTDLAELLQSASSKILSDAFAEQQPTYKRFTSPMSLRDFKATPIVQLSSYALAAKTEGGDYAEATLVDTNEMITLRERGIRFSISQKALINDDLGGLSTLPAKAAMSGHNDVEAAVYSIITTNAALTSDSLALFHATHGNLTAAGGGVPSVASLTVVQQAMMSQTGLNGEKLELRVKYLLVNPAHEVAAKQLASSTMIPGTVSAVNPWAGQIEVIVSSRIPSTYWIACADPMQMAAIVTGTLAGMEEPQVTSEPDFKSSNLGIKVEFHNTAAVNNYRAIYKTVV